MQTNYSAVIESLANILEAVDNLQAELKTLRDTVPDKDWDSLAESPFGDLLAHCIELEACFEA